MKWIVFWVLVTYSTVITPPQKNEFGITEGWSYPETQVTYDTLSKVFDSADSAIAFIERSSKYWCDGHVLTLYPKNMKKIWVEPYSCKYQYLTDTLQTILDTLGFYYQGTEGSYLKLSGDSVYWGKLKEKKKK